MIPDIPELGSPGFRLATPVEYCPFRPIPFTATGFILRNLTGATFCFSCISFKDALKPKVIAILFAENSLGTRYVSGWWMEITLPLLNAPPVIKSVAEKFRRQMFHR